MEINSKKGFNPTPLLGAAFLLLVLFLIFSGSSEETLESPIGLKQYDILFANEQSEAISSYVDFSADYSSKIAYDSLFFNSGIYEQKSSITPSFEKCGKHIYPRYNFKEKDCLPSFEASFESYYRKSLTNYLSNYEEQPLIGSLYVDLIKDNVRSNYVSLEGSFENLKFPINSREKFEDIKKIKYPSGLFGTYDNEEMILCSTGICFSQSAEYFYEFYTRSGLQLSFVNGGSSPYTYADSLQSDFFKGVTLRPTEIGEGGLTRPGFDGAGFSWWVGNHTEVPFFKERKSTEEYYNLAKEDLKIICEEDDCSKEFISTNAKPGDLVFTFKENENPTHMMIYIGEDFVIHSRPGIGLVKEKLSTNFYLSEETKIDAVYRLNFLEDGNEKLSGFSKSENGECVLPVDFSQINMQALRNKPGSVKDLVSVFQKYDQWQYLEEASVRFPKVPKELLIGILNIEVGSYYAEGYLSGSKKVCSSESICGVTQVYTDTCTTLATTKTYACDYDKIRSGDHREAIMSGAAYLNYLMTKYPNYIDPQNPDYYFVALAYNAGPGSLAKILNYASKRLDKPILSLKWRDITYEDIREGLLALKSSTFESKNKWDEVYEYPNKLALSLQQQCDGSIFAGISSSTVNSKSYFKFSPKFSDDVKINFDELEQVNEFVDYVLETCEDKLDVCVNKAVSDFNKNSQVKITINGEDESLAYDFIDQYLDCYENGQKDCACRFEIDEDLNSDFSSPVIELTESGVAYVGEISRARVDKDTRKLVSIIPSNPTKTYLSSKNPDYVQVIINEEKEISMDFERAWWPDKTWVLKDGELEDEDEMNALGVAKIDNTLKWIPYRDGYGKLSCKNNKNSFRFQAHFTFTDETINFSVYLNDSVEPELNLEEPSFGSCFSQINTIISWSVPKEDNYIHEFSTIISNEQLTSDDPFDYTFYVEDAKEIKLTSEVFESGKLYKIVDNKKTTYYVKFDKYLKSESMIEGEGTGYNYFDDATTYYFKVRAEDAYDNNFTSIWNELTTPKISVEGLIIDGMVGGSLISNLLCGEKERTHIKSLEDLYSFEEREIETDEGLEVYPDIKHPETGENLYRITNIPNVICRETGSDVGRICAANKELIYALQELSETYLVPRSLNLEIAQAFRTYEIQKKLFDINGKDPSKACNPDREKLCPHEVAGAIDVIIYNGSISYKNRISKIFQEDLMCKSGFVRYGGESWHFEYGTPRWREAEQQRELGNAACYYGWRDVLADSRTNYISPLDQITPQNGGEYIA